MQRTWTYCRSCKPTRGTLRAAFVSMTRLGLGHLEKMRNVRRAVAGVRSTLLHTEKARVCNAHHVLSSCWPSHVIISTAFGRSESIPALEAGVRVTAARDYFGTERYHIYSHKIFDMFSFSPVMHHPPEMCQIHTLPPHFLLSHKSIFSLYVI